MPIDEGCMPGPSLQQTSFNTSDVASSCISDFDLESFLTLDWEAPPSSTHGLQIGSTDTQQQSLLPSNLIPTPQIEINESSDKQKQSHQIGMVNEPKEQEHCVKQLIDPSIIIQSNAHLCSIKEVGKLAVLLAKESFFGANVLQQSTVTGKGKSKALDSAKMSSFLSIIRTCQPSILQDVKRRIFERS